ncbi:PIN domain-containing protein [Microbacterium karelineae]|uniref:PIN domain-containing protein n=1 Tax=Microbacterium karelineae TaxID=2654283 RepID=UPI0012EACD6B|nr:PIN domain-containing protein [Microbacterium karelineae]
MILLDTSVLIALPEVEIPDDDIAVSAISYAELSFGVAVATDPTVRRERRRYLAELDDALGVDWLPFDRTAGDGYATLAARIASRRPSHARSKDILIAGHAYALGARLATLNPRDFELVSDEVGVEVPARR